MTALKLKRVAFGGDPTSTRPTSAAPVRAQSKNPLDPVLKGFNRRVTYRERQLAQEAVTAFCIRSRRFERAKSERALRAGELWKSARDVFDYLCGLAYSCEEVFPSVETIAEATGLSESTVHEGKAQLQALGLLDWRHRAEAVDNPGPGAPPIRQISNLYRINELPPRVLECLPAPRRAVYALELAARRKTLAGQLKKRRADAEARRTNLKSRPLHPDAKRMLIEGLRGIDPAPGASRDSS